MKIRFFNCYSVPLKNFLMDKGFRYASVGINPKTSNTYWLFVRDEEFDKTLTEWKLTKPE